MKTRETMVRLTLQATALVAALAVLPGCGDSGADADENTPPEFTKQSSAMVNTARIGHMYADVLVVSDADGDDVALALVAGPDGMALVGNVVAWVPNAWDAGHVTVQVEAEDENGGITSFAWVIHVDVADSTNMAPEFLVTPLDLPAQVPLGMAYSAVLPARDDDGDSLAYVLVVSDPGMTLVDSVFHWVPTAADVGTTEVTASVFDSRGGADLLTWQITVVDSGSSGDDLLPLDDAPVHEGNL